MNAKRPQHRYLGTGTPALALIRWTQPTPVTGALAPATEPVRQTADPVLAAVTTAAAPVTQPVTGLVGGLLG